MIVGKGGSFIKQFKEDSGAYIQISHGLLRFEDCSTNVMCRQEMMFNPHVKIPTVLSIYLYLVLQQP
jgi:hypothetical protein